MSIHQSHTIQGAEYQTIDSNVCGSQFMQLGFEQFVDNRSRANIKRFKKLIEQAPDAFFSHDLQGKLIEVNEQTCRQLGYQRDEILGLNAKNIQRGIAPELAKSLWQKVMNGETVLTEDILQRKDGSTFPAEVKIGLYKDGNVMEIFGFFRDITERRRLEEERETLITELQKALAEVKTLRGIIPICSYCKKIRDGKGYWEQVEEYLSKQTDAKFTHGICSGCHQKEIEKYRLNNKD